MLERARRRLYSDFLLPDRTEHYRRLIEAALRHGYACRPVGECRRGRTLVLRHDVDTDPATARVLWSIEQELGVTASYFFRLSTADVGLMREIAAAGHEVGYHYEEIATIAKELRLRSKAEVKPNLPAIRERFAENLRDLRARTGLPLTVVASHGDAVNRHLGYRNYKLLTPKLRAELGIVLEVYDAEATEGVTSRFSDCEHPRLWEPQHPGVALERGDEVVYVLTHPRHWRSNRRANLADDLVRVRDGLRYRGLL